MQITWSDNSDNEDEFIISRRFSNEIEFESIAYLAENETMFIDDVDNTVNYCYVVSASNEHGQSNSDEMCTDFSN